MAGLLTYNIFAVLPIKETFVVETDYWMRCSGQYSHVAEANEPDLRQLVGDLLKNQFRYFRGDLQMQELILWELSTDSDLMKSIHRTRENMGQQIIGLMGESFKNGPVNFGAVAALLVGGIYYTVLHTRYNGAMFTGVNLSSPEGQDDILKAIDFLIDAVFKAH